MRCRAGTPLAEQHRPNPDRGAVVKDRLQAAGVGTHVSEQGDRRGGGQWAIGVFGHCGGAGAVEGDRFQLVEGSVEVGDNVEVARKR